MNIIELAEQAGLAYKTPKGTYWIDAGYPDIHLERFAELVAEQTHTNNKAQWYQEGYEAGKHDERESCAKLCEEKALYFQYDFIAPYDVADSCAEEIRARRDGIALTNTQHPEGNPVPDDHEINPDSLETVEIEIPMDINEINDAFDREYEIHSKDPVYRIIRACGSSTANSDINVFALERIIEDIKAEEREACARLCEDECKIRLAETIRARGKPQRPVKSYTNGEPQYATDDMSTKSQNIDTSEERVHEIDKSIHDDDDIQEYKRPWIGLSDEEAAIYSNVFNGIRLVREIEAQLKERNNG